MRLVPSLVVLLLFTGCAARAPEPTDFIGTWQYDRVSLKDEALLSAIDSASGGEPESLSDEELAEVVAWVDENHATWDKSIIIEPDGRFKMISRVGDGRAEIIEGKWQQDATGLRLLETDGQEVAFALLSGNRLELAPSGDDTGSGVMVMERTAD